MPQLVLRVALEASGVWLLMMAFPNGRTEAVPSWVEIEIDLMSLVMNDKLPDAIREKTNGKPYFLRKHAVACRLGLTETCD